MEPEVSFQFAIVNKNNLVFAQPNYLYICIYIYVYIYIYIYLINTLDKMNCKRPLLSTDDTGICHVTLRYKTI